MVAQSGKQGGSKTKCENQKKTSRTTPPPQAQDTPRRGIQLLPFVKFQFDEEQRAALAKILKVPQPDLGPLLDRVETHVGAFLSDRLQRQGASTPARLRKKLKRIRGRACSLLTALSEVSSVPSPFAPDGYVLGTMLTVEGRAYSPGENDMLGQLRNRLILLVAIIDAALAGEVEALEEQLRSLEQAAPEAMDMARCIELSLRMKYHKKVAAHAGGQEKASESRLITQLARSYRDLLGGPLTVSPGSPFFEFVHDVFMYALPAEHVDAEEHTRLLKKAVADPR